MLHTKVGADTQIMAARAKINVKSEREVTVSDLVEMANLIWKLVSGANIPVDDIEGSTRMATRMQRDYPQFCMAYPIVIKYICHMRSYDSTVFRLWLERIKTSPWTNEVGYLDAQADYVTALFRKKQPRANSAARRAFRDNIRNILQQEHDAIKKAAHTAEDEITAEQKERESNSARELVDFAKLVGPGGMKPAGTFRVEADVCPSHNGLADLEIPILPPLSAEFDL